MRLKNSTLPTLLLLLAAAAPASAFLVSGRVLDPGGLPAEGVDLDFIDRATGDNLPLTGDLTDAGGLYAVDVPAASYTVRYIQPIGPRWAALEESPVDVAGDWNRPDVQMPEGWAVTGGILDHAGAPVGAADLDFYDSLTGAFLYVVREGTSAGGHFSVLVPCGTWDIVFEPPEGHPDAARRIDGVEVDCVDTHLGDITLELGAILQGLVTMQGAGGEVRRADINVRDPDTGERLPTPRDDTDNTGFYLVVVPPGTYLVQVTPPLGSRALPAEEPDVVISGTTVLDFELAMGVRLSGTVTSAADGSLIEGAFVNVHDAVTGDRLRTSDNRTDLLGFYEFALPEGTYDITFLPPAGSPFLPLERTGVDVRSGNEVLDVSLEAGYRLTGRVVRASDLTPIPGVDTDLDHPTLGRILTPFDDTDADGRFVVAAPGGTDYSLFIEPPHTWLPVRIVPVDLPADWTDLGDIPLDEGVEVTGRLLRASDLSPVADVDLDFIHATLGEVVTPTDNSGADGVFRVWVPEGDYDIEIEPGALPLADKVLEGMALFLPGPVDLGDILLEEAAFVTGVVVEAGTGTPLPNVDLDFNDPDLGPIVTPGDDTGPDGTFAVKVPPGPYTVDFEPVPGDPHAARMIDVVVEAPATDLGTIELEAAAFLTGRVIRASDLTPVEGADIDVIHPVQGKLLTPLDDTDASGIFQVAVPPSAGYAVDIDPPAGSGLIGVVLDPVDVQMPMTDLGDIALQQAMLLQGIVRDPLGNPLPGCDLDIFEAGTQNEIFTPNDDTDGSGFYQIPLAAGVYDVRAQPANGLNMGWEYAFSVSVAASPTVLDFDLVWLLTGIVPASGPTAGGAPVTITGNRFDGQMTISLDGVLLGSLAVTDPNTLTGTTPPHRAGMVDIVARYTSGERGFLLGAYEYLEPADPALLFVSRLGQDVLLTWTDTGQGSYAALRSESPDMSDATLLFQGAGTQAVDAGAVESDIPLLFYDVE